MSPYITSSCLYQIFQNIQNQYPPIDELNCTRIKCEMNPDLIYTDLNKFKSKLLKTKYEDDYYYDEYFIYECPNNSRAYFKNISIFNETRWKIKCDYNIIEDEVVPIQKKENNFISCDGKSYLIVDIFKFIIEINLCVDNPYICSKNRKQSLIECKIQGNSYMCVCMKGKENIDPKTPCFDCMIIYILIKNLINYFSSPMYVKKSLS